MCMGTCISVYHVCLGTEEAGRGPLIPWSWSNMIVSYHVGAGNEPCCSQVQPVGVFLFWFGFGFGFLCGIICTFSMYFVSFAYERTSLTHSLLYCLLFRLVAFLKTILG